MANAFVASRRGFLRALSPCIGTLIGSSCARTRTGQIAVIPKTTSIDYWENLHVGALRAADRLHVRVYWNAPQSEANFAEQALMVEDLIHRRVDGIVLAPSHESVLASAVRHAKSENIPLVLVDSPVMVDERDYVAYIGSDQEHIGSLAAMRTGAVLRGHGMVGLIGVSPTLESAVLRERSFTRTLRREFPKIELVEPRYGLADHSRSREIAAQMLSAFPLDALFASDQFATRGALIALRQFAQRHSVKLVGVAQERDLLAYLERSEIDALVVQDSFNMGVSSMDIMSRALTGAYRGPKRIQTGVELVTREALHLPRVQQIITRRT